MITACRVWHAPNTETATRQLEKVSPSSDELMQHMVVLLHVHSLQFNRISEPTNTTPQLDSIIINHRYKKSQQNEAH